MHMCSLCMRMFHQYNQVHRAPKAPRGQGNCSPMAAHLPKEQRNMKTVAGYSIHNEKMSASSSVGSCQVGRREMWGCIEFDELPAHGMYSIGEGISRSTIRLDSQMTIVPVPKARSSEPKICGAVGKRSIPA